MAMDLDEMILRFFRNDIGRILITDEDGKVLYEDAKAAFVRQVAKAMMAQGIV